MCCFSRPTPPNWLARVFSPPPKLDVSGTKIFARVETGEQWLVYAMALETPSDVAMVLPLPVASSADDALSFVDLSGYAELFDKLDELYAPPYMPMFGMSRGAPQALHEPMLVVHQVGSFEASFVPRLSDMTRLDPRFRIPDKVWAQRPEYADYGFAVFKLSKSKRAKQAIHPMAMRFPSQQPRSIFFPTVHVHDGELHERAGFDHLLYYQLAPGDRGTAAGPDGDEVLATAAPRKVTDVVDVMKTRGVVTHDGQVHRFALRGSHANRDVRVALG